MRSWLVFGILLGCWRTTAAESFPTNVRDEMNVEAEDWPWWRGPQRNGTAHARQRPPLHWSETQNVSWKARVPGRGHGSPTVVGGHVYLATADRTRDLQSVLCYARASGEQLWEAIVHRGGLMRKNEKASQASPTVAWDGERLFINFLNDGAVYTTALSAEGKQLWQTRVHNYVIHQGYAASPVVYRDLVIVAADHKGGGALVALSRKHGDEVWRRERPKLPNYPTPTLIHAAGKDQLIMIGCKRVSSFDPLTGETHWEIEGATEECVTSTVTDGTCVFSSGGYPENHVSAIRADGSGDVVWRNATRIYVPSMLIKDGALFGILDAGVAVCWTASSGQERWKHRLGGTFSASPVLVDDLIFATNESGATFVLRARPDQFELIAENQLGDDVFATPTICGSRIYARVAKFEGDQRQEYLYCLAQQP